MKLIDCLNAIFNQGLMGDDVVVRLYPYENKLMRLNERTIIGGKHYYHYVISRSCKHNPVSNDKLIVQSLYSYGYDDNKMNINITIKEKE